MTRVQFLINAAAELDAACAIFGVGPRERERACHDIAAATAAAIRMGECVADLVLQFDSDAPGHLRVTLGVPVRSSVH